MKSNRAISNRIPISVRASLGLFVANLITKGIAYLTTPIFTRIMSSYEYGRVAVFTTWLTIFGYLAMFCLSAGVFNNGMSDYPKKRDEYSLSMLVLSNVITLVFSFLIIIVYPWIASYLKIDFWLIILMCLIFLFQPAYNFWYTRQRYEYKYKNVILATSVSAFFSQLISILCVLFLDGDKDFLKIVGSELPLIIFYAFFYFYLFKKADSKLETKYWKAAIVFNLPLLPHYLSTYLLSSADKIMISNFIGDNATAFYTIAHSVASVALIVWSAINGSLLPFIYEKCKRNEFDKIDKASKPIILFFAVVCFAIILFAPEVIKIMATKEYYESIYVIPPIICGVFFQVQYYLYANVLFYYKKPIYVMIGSISAFIINIILNVCFIPTYGYVAAGYTTLISYLIQAIIDYIAMKKIIKVDIYDGKFILILSLLVVITAMFTNFIYELTIVRYIILVAIALFAFIFRKKIIAFLNFNKPMDYNVRKRNY